MLNLTWVPFGMKNIGRSFIQEVQQILQSFKHLTQSYVDDMVIHSMILTYHPHDLTLYLVTIRKSGLTLNI